MLIPFCQIGIGIVALIPPALPSPKPAFQTVSEAQAPVASVLKVVPPTIVIFGSSVGGSTAPEYASPSPEALKQDWPWAANCRKIWSLSGSMA
jgi:hypothetical protein